MSKERPSPKLPCGRPAPVRQPRMTHQSWRNNLEQFLKERNLRSSQQRDEIAEIAMNSESHFDIQTLIKDVQKKHPQASAATVYRTVRTLVDAGLLIETLQLSTDVSLYEVTDPDHHDHIVCLDCKTIFEFHDDGIETAQNQLLKGLNFKGDRHHHVLYAHCGLIKSKA